jgi:hypothetical protein
MEAATYAPLILALYAPLTLFAFPVAKIIWLTFNFILVWLSIFLLVRLVEDKVNAYAAIAMTLLVTNYAVIARNLAIGQSNIPIFVLLCLGFIFLKTGREVSAGIMFMLAAIYKPIPAILFAGLFLKRKWKAVLGGVVTLLICVLISIFFLGWAFTAPFWQRYCG